MSKDTIPIGDQNVAFITLPDGRRAISEDEFRRIMADIDKRQTKRDRQLGLTVLK